MTTPIENVTEQAVTEQTAAEPKTVNVKQVLEYLAQQFPQCFSLQGEIKPLKIGIFQDLAERTKDDSTISKTQIRQALRLYTSSWRYLDAVKVGAARVDLDGIAGDVIDELQAEHAANTLKESKAKAAEKRKAKQQEAAKNRPAPEKPAYKKVKNKPASPASNKSDGKFKTRTAPVKQETSTPPALQNLSQVIVGSNVLVKLGQAPMPATVLEVHRDDVTVQLSSGMVIKTRQDSLYQA